MDLSNSEKPEKETVSPYPLRLHRGASQLFVHFDRLFNTTATFPTEKIHTFTLTFRQHLLLTHSVPQAESKEISFPSEGGKSRFTARPLTRVRSSCFYASLMRIRLYIAVMKNYYNYHN